MFQHTHTDKKKNTKAPLRIPLQMNYVTGNEKNMLEIWCPRNQILTSHIVKCYLKNNDKGVYLDKFLLNLVLLNK